MWSNCPFRCVKELATTSSGRLAQTGSENDFSEWETMHRESVLVSQGILHHHPAFHHELYLLQHCDVGKRIALDGN